MIDLLAEKPDLVDAQLVLANLNLSEGRTREAEAIFAKIQKAGSGGAKNFDVAVDQLKRLTAADPSNASYRVRLAEVYFFKSDTSAAVAELAGLSAKDPANTGHLLNLGLTLQAGGRLPDADGLADSGSDLEEALQHAGKARRLSKDSPGVIDTLGWVYYKKGVTDSAVQIFSKLAKDSPKVVAFRYHLALALVAKGDKSRARTELETALASKPSPSEERRIVELMKTIG